MKVSERGLAFIAAHEGFVARGYLDPAGIVTIGYGFTMRSRVFAAWWRAHHSAPLKVGDTLPREEANKLLLNLLDREYAPPVIRALPGLPQEQFDACVSVVYNLGPRALTWKWAKALAKGEPSQAAALLQRTGTTAGGRRLAGLVRRRSDEARLLLGQGYGTDTASRDGPDPAIKAAQEKLAALGYRPGPADGMAGASTRQAVLAFQKDHPPLTVDGRLGPATEATLARAVDRRQGERIGGLASGATALAAGLAKWDWPAILTGVALVLGLTILVSLLWRHRGRIWPVSQLLQVFSL